MGIGVGIGNQEARHVSKSIWFVPIQLRNIHGEFSVINIRSVSLTLRHFLPAGVPRIFGDWPQSCRRGERTPNPQPPTLVSSRPSFRSSICHSLFAMPGDVEIFINPIRSLVAMEDHTAVF